MKPFLNHFINENKNLKRKTAFLVMMFKNVLGFHVPEQNNWTDTRIGAEAEIVCFFKKEIQGR